MVSSQGDSYYIICEDLFKIYKIADLEVVALRGLDLKVKLGELMAIAGISGSGKTTLLNILGGLDTPTAGKVIVGERNLLKMSSRDLVTYRRRDIGFVWQQVARVASKETAETGREDAGGSGIGCAAALQARPLVWWGATARGYRCRPSQ